MLLTIGEYVRLPDDGPPTELVRGKVVEGRFKYPFEGFVCGNIGGETGRYAEDHRLGRVCLSVGVATGRDPDTVRVADIAFYSYARLPGPLPDEGYGTVAPDLAFEVVSLSDRWSKVLRKVADFLSAGVKAVCVMNTGNMTATVYRDDQDPEAVAADADLTLPDVLPGFRVPLRQFFE